jgi:hypothetical protein
MKKLLLTLTALASLTMANYSAKALNKEHDFTVGLGSTLEECKQFYAALDKTDSVQNGPLGKDDLGFDRYQFVAEGYAITVSLDETGKVISITYSARGTFEDGMIAKLLANNAPKAKWYGRSTDNLNYNPYYNKPYFWYAAEDKNLDDMGCYFAVLRTYLLRKENEFELQVGTKRVNELIYEHGKASEL